MASGHPSFGTFHAGSVETLVRRLETPPINLSSSLVESLDVVCVSVHVKSRNQNFRRIKVINEIKSINQNGCIDHEALYSWNPVDDTTQKNSMSLVLNKISKRTGIPIERIQEELILRTKLLKVLAEKKIFDFKELNKELNAFYQNPKSILLKHGIIKWLK